MKKSIKKTKEFRIVYNNKKSCYDAYFILYIYENTNIKENRIGISISKKVGNSDLRYKIKRRIREVFYHNNISLKKAYDIVIVCKIKSREIDFKDINNSFVNLCRKQNILKEIND